MDRNRKDVTKTPRMDYWKGVGLNVLTGTLVVGFFLLVFSSPAEAWYSHTPVSELTAGELFDLIREATRR